MKKVAARSVALGLTLVALAGCGKSPTTAPSDIYTEKTLFQHSEVEVYEDTIYFNVDYYSTGPVSIDGTSDKQYAYIDNSDYRFTDSDWYKSVTHTTQGSERIGIRLTRENGVVLDSYIQLDGRAQFTAPPQDTSINLTNEDLLLEWNSAPHDRQWLTFRGTCIDSTDIALDKDVTNYLVLAGTISVDSGSSGCAVNIGLRQQISGFVDENFAGGTFELTHSPVLSIIVTRN